MCSQREYCIEVHINQFSINPWHGEESCLYMWKLCICIWCSIQYPCMCCHRAALLCSWHKKDALNQELCLLVQREPCIQMHGSKSLCNHVHDTKSNVSKRMTQGVNVSMCMTPSNVPKWASMSITHRSHFLCAEHTTLNLYVNVTKSHVCVCMTLKSCAFCSWHNELYIWKCMIK